MFQQSPLPWKSNREVCYRSCLASPHLKNPNSPHALPFLEDHCVPTLLSSSLPPPSPPLDLMTAPFSPISDFLLIPRILNSFNSSVKQFFRIYFLGERTTRFFTSLFQSRQKSYYIAARNVIRESSWFCVDIPSGKRVKGSKTTTFVNIARSFIRWLWLLANVVVRPKMWWSIYMLEHVELSIRLSSHCIEHVHIVAIYSNDSF